MDLPSFDYYADSQRKFTRRLLMQELFEEDSEKRRHTFFYLISFSYKDTV